MTRFDLWVSKAIMRNVREMDIDLLECERMHLPANMCSLTTLEVLRLCFDFALLDHSDGMCFPNLNILHILIQYPKNRVKEKLFFSCLSLTELNIMVFILPYDPLANFIIRSATLNTLTFVTLFAQLCSKSYHHHIVIRVLNLQHLCIVNHMLMEYEVHEMQSYNKQI